MYVWNELPFLPFFPPAFGLPFLAALPDGDRSFLPPFAPFLAAASTNLKCIY